MKKVLVILVCSFFLLVFGSSNLFSDSLGDVNEDGNINIVDALSIVNYYAGIKNPNFNTANADIDGDSVITLSDALLIARNYVGKKKSSPGRMIFPQKIQLGKPFKIRYGQAVKFDGKNTLRFTQVVADGRCPTNARCVWQGEVQVKLKYSVKGKKSGSISLSSEKNQQAKFENYTIKMDNKVMPPRGTTQNKIPKSAYIIKLTITKDKPVSNPKLVWVSVASGLQCSPPIYSSEEDAKKSLEKKGIRVYKTKTRNLKVLAACGRPMGVHYLALISINDLGAAIKAGWRRDSLK